MTWLIAIFSWLSGAYTVQSVMFALDGDRRRSFVEAAAAVVSITSAVLIMVLL